MRPIFFYGLCLFACACSSPAKDRETDPEEFRNELKPTEVAVIPAELKTFNYTVIATGKIEADQFAEARFGTSGLVKDLKVRNGQKVRQGAILAELYNQELQLSLKKAEANWKQMEYDYRSQLLSYSEKDLAGVRGDTIRESIAFATGYANAKIEYDLAIYNFQQATLKAPISGVVANVTIKPQNYISADETVCEIYAPESIRAVVHIMESDFSKLKLGQSATLSSAAIDKDISCIVERINPIIDEAGMIEVVLKVNNYQSLLPGMNVQASIDIPTNEAVVVPKEAIVVRGGRQVVFVAEAGKAKWQYVKTGLDNGESVEVLEGLEVGQKVILKNNLQLAHGAAIIF
ncbi:efflux RND transporter periplasmic adaptor subunit [Fulvivirga maritima]|uniref:efflux RND transporter periplasmic adaptor subunit n=1 Tax=Fulvivirga maritima TaxID=2904247 RepID=UPI001F48335B|nr:efflux RND transporter periplasmic adaptor subunit [Fulvivirga maritima]UII28636.1 efflux RND transporter periplasmic adaptor subunit [Fulvivirga maritima]